jgi:hypothetical protein
MILDKDSWRNWHGDLDNPNVSQDDCAADNESDVLFNNRMEDQESSK